MRQSANNTFKDGMNLDLHPIVTPNTVLTDNLNGTFITYNGNEFCLQNDRGNKQVADFPEELTPIGAKEYNGVIYIVSVRDTDGGTETEIGTYPGINWLQDKGDLDYTEYTPLRIMGDKSIRISIESYTPDRTIDLDAEQIYNYAAGMNITVLSVEDYKNLLTNKYIDIPVEASYNTIYRVARDVLENFKNPLSLGEITIEESFYHSGITDFRAIGLGYTTKTPVTIEIQPSYDGSVNLILVADNIEPRIINSGFSVLPNGKYKITSGQRNQTKQTNVYSSNIDILKEEIALVRRTNILTNIDLLGVQSGGQWKGGNYTFYIKFGDADYNQTDVVAESGIVSIFNGNDGVPSTISGTLADERTDKMICLGIDGLNDIYSKIYIYYTREYSDTNGFRMTESGMLTEPIDIKPDEGKPNYQTIWLTGFEATQAINVEELNVDYHTINSARAEAQNANMLFLGNIKQNETFDLYKQLKSIALDTQVEIVQENEIVNSGYDYDINDSEYYSTKNIYNYLGYWPNEIYRFGIVFILKDGSKTPVFNVTGKDFRDIPEPLDDNDRGVFITPDSNIYSEDKIKPIGFRFTLNGDFPDNVIGWFVVRQKRIPNTICQGLAIGVDNKSNTPIIWDGKNWISESFLSVNRYAEDGSIVPSGSSLMPLLVYSNIQSRYKTTDLDEIKKLWLDENGYGGVYWNWEEQIRIEIQTGTEDGQYNPNAFPNDINSEYFISDCIDLFGTILNNEVISSGDYGTYYIQYPKSGKYFWYQAIEVLKNNKKATWQLYKKYKIDINDLDSEPVFQNEYLFVFNNTTRESYVDATKVVINQGDILRQKILEARTIEGERKWKKYIESTKFENKIIRESKESENSENAWFGARGLISLDPCVNPSIQSMLDGSEFYINQFYSTKFPEDSTDLTLRLENQLDEKQNSTGNKLKASFISSNTGLKLIGEYGFSTVAGNAADVSSYKYFSTPFGVTRSNDIYYYDQRVNIWNDDWFKSTNNVNILRGLFTPFIGIADKNISRGIYNLSLKDWREFNLNDIFPRKQDNSEYYCISPYFKIENNSNIVYRGDCYTNTVTMRIIRNFIDPSVPTNEVIVDKESWNTYAKLKYQSWEEDYTEDNKVQFEEVNRADVNTVDLGLWVTFKCLSSYNLGLRSIDTFNPEEMALMGSARSFFPLNGASTATGNKLEESFLLNDGLSATVGRKRYNLLPDTPYNKSEFANRIMFSNVNVTDSFTNGYRTFQGLSYQDYDKQYGAITKLISWGTNLFVVMEHGLALVPVNEKALMQTTTGEAIHIYGHGVLPDQMTIISQDFGSKYEHSVIRTPIGIYGIDTDARKIWRFSDKNGFETLSDMKIETYLNDNLFTDKEVDIETCDVRAHYDSFKGDVMFTFYNRNKNGE